MVIKAVHDQRASFEYTSSGQQRKQSLFVDSEQNMATKKRRNSVQQFQFRVYPGLYIGYMFVPGQTVVDANS